MSCFKDKCNTSCTVDTASSCPPVEPINNTVGYTCATPKATPTLDQYTGEYADQFVDPINALVAGCGGMLPSFDFTCNRKYTQELNRYMFPGVDSSIVDSNDANAQFDYYRNFTSVSQAANYASAFSAAENVYLEEYTCPDGEVKCATAFLWKEKSQDDGCLRIILDAAAGDVDVTVDYANGLHVGGYLTIIPCSDDECATHPFVSEIVAVDPETGVVTLCEPLPFDILAVQTDVDEEGNPVGCGSCETKAKYSLPNVGCGDCLESVGTLGGQEEVVKKAYFRKWGQLLKFNEKEIRTCYECAGDFGGDEYGYAHGNSIISQKLGQFRENLDFTLLNDYFFAPGPGFSKANCAPTTGPGIITSILAADAEGCCSLHDLCGKKPVEKALALLQIMDEIECCDDAMNSNVRMIMNQQALTNWKKLTKEWNRLLGVATCCESQDGVKNFNRMASVQSYLSDRPYTPELSAFLTEMYNVGVILFIPDGHTIMRSVPMGMGEGFNMVNGANVNFLNIKELDLDDNECINCDRALKVTGEYLIAHINGCNGKSKLILGF